MSPLGAVDIANQYARVAFPGFAKLVCPKLVLPGGNTCFGRKTELFRLEYVAVRQARGQWMAADQGFK